MRTTRIAWIACLGLSGMALGGDILTDGDFDALAIGSPPDCAAFAGAWGWPQNYIDLLLCEVGPGQYRINSTAVFDPLATGNSLAHFVNDQTLVANFHLPNIWTQTLNEADGVIVTVSFDIWVDVVDVSGGHVYIGGDHGGGGFDLGLDRGPQLYWVADGNLAYTSWGGDATLPPIITNLTTYNIDEWQSVRVEIDLVSDTFDFYHGPKGGDLIQIGDNLGFRSPVLDHLDRITVVHFGATASRDQAYLDNFVVCTDDCPDSTPVCEGDANADGTVDPLDSGYVLSRFGCDVSDPDCAAADQNADGVVDPLDAGFVLSRFGACPAGLLDSSLQRQVFTTQPLELEVEVSGAGI